MTSLMKGTEKNTGKTRKSWNWLPMKQETLPNWNSITAQMEAKNPCDIQA